MTIGHADKDAIETTWELLRQEMHNAIEITQRISCHTLLFLLTVEYYTHEITLTHDALSWSERDIEAAETAI